MAGAHASSADLIAAPAPAVRPPAVAGRFYPADAEQCRSVAAELIRSGSSAEVVGEAAAGGERWLGGIVPHAGWICSGAIAGETIGTIARSIASPDVVVVFGAVHTALPLDSAVLASHVRWATPNATSDVAAELSAKLEAQSDLVGVDDRFHRHEHAIEVELPLIQSAWPNARLLPVEVPLFDDAVGVGIDTARLINDSGLRAVYLASSDLTHYGPDYGLAPAGVGVAALDWANENDSRLMDVVTLLSPEAVVPHVREFFNACGGGAIAAMMAACRETGASRVNVLRMANSYEILRPYGYNRPDNAVGYASVVIGE